MVKVSKGSTLLEVMLYAAVNAGLIIIVFITITLIQRTMLEQKNLRKQLVENTIVFDLLRRDIMSARGYPSCWDATLLYFEQELLDARSTPYQRWIGWHIVHHKTKHGINRIEGIYDVSAKKWHSKKKTDFFPCSITTLSHTLLYAKNNLIKAVNIQYGTKKESSKNFLITLRNRSMEH